MGRVCRLFQLVQRAVGGGDQRLVAAVSGINHMEYLFQSIVGATLHAEVVNDKQRIAAKAGNILIPACKAGREVAQDNGEVRHIYGDFFLHEGVCDQVVFLDICMEGTNGIETARRLRAADPDLLIVFVTSSPEYVWDAFPVHPFDYLLKPYKEEKFEQLAGELRRVLCRQQPELEVRIARQIVRLPLTKIYYATAQNHYVRVVTDDGECRATANFAQVQEQLQTQPEFLVCNRGVIINMSKVLRFEGDCIEMLDGTHLPVRQKDKNSLLAQFTQYQFRGMQREF